MVLTTDGSVRIATVPEKLDLAQANTEIVDTQKIQPEIERTVAERADEPGKEFDFECRANKHLSADVPTMRTTHDDPSCEERRMVLGLRQISPVSRNQTNSRRLPVSPWTRRIATMVTAATQLDREYKHAWHGEVKVHRHDLREHCASANSPTAAATSAVGRQSTQLGYWSGCDMATRRGTHRDLDMIYAQRPRHVGHTSQALQYLLSDSRRSWTT